MGLLRVLMILGAVALLIILAAVGVAVIRASNTSGAADGHPTPIKAKSTVIARPSLTPASINHCRTKGTDCEQALLQVINEQRVAHGARPLVLDQVQSRGTGVCVGAVGHAQAMAASNRTWHFNKHYPDATFPQDICEAVQADTTENDGRSRGAQWDALQRIQTHFLNGRWKARTVPRLVSGKFTRVGIGIAHKGNLYYLTEDFLP